MKLLKPTVNTKFHIDFSWWEKQNKDIRVLMKELLCPECSKTLADTPETQMVDLIDPETAEVTRVDAVWEAIRACCSTKPDYITPDTPLIESIFRVLLANGNKPLSILELHERIDKQPPETILRLLTRGQIYKGIKPVHGSG
nr:hypothetical protein [Chloroflexota bacterium]